MNGFPERWLLGGGRFADDGGGETNSMTNARLWLMSLWLAAALVASLPLFASLPMSEAQAGWLSRLTRAAGEAGEAGGKAARLGIADLERAGAHIRTLPIEARAGALAAHATPEGHWKFVNRDGEVFTAGTSDELARAVPTLLPQARGSAPLNIYLSEDTVFANRAALKDLPSGSKLHLVTRHESYPLKDVKTAAGGNALVAELRPHVSVDLADRALFSEAVAQLERPLSRSAVRTLALEPGGPATLSSYPRLETGTKSALVDAIDPASLSGALGSVRGQTVLVTGRVENNLLYFRPASGAEQSLRLADLKRAATDADVNLVIVRAGVPHQPGGRNWLWQKISVGGLDDALKRATLGDFIDALGTQHGTFRISAERDGYGRVALRAMPEGGVAEPITDFVGGFWTSTISNVTGSLVATGVDIHARDEARQSELDMRIVPFVPAWVQYLYLASLAAGVIGWSVTRSWFDRIWRPEQRADYRGAFGFRAAQIARFFAGLLVFTPVVGVPAVIVSLWLQFWAVITMPVRGLRWLLSRSQVRAS
ncbi:hypothetical protein [Hyphomicrobium sulfonivorans]|uniref:hypothetical protein n=1 Tax=Hyphomicrobium sulfonivorans TaxID=121290 RepID=UPI00156E2FD1|nr:hypothetical protein [Hyphomicrobium sulfonivorans]MBI1649768.1 hypothetical protein [Hyphomicrobium sulfonivorans]NSL71684.1 hypothetical protein [Hyphomicrobium sulfonivorans]